MTDQRIIDSHVHLWGTSVAGARWLQGGSTESLRREFGVAELQSLLRSSRIGSAVVVSAEQSVAESLRLMRECRNEPAVAGIVGWVDPYEDIRLQVEAIRTGDGGQTLLGLRYSVISEAPGWLRDPAISNGLAEVGRSGLVLELLLAADQLQDAAGWAQSHPETTVVIDHLGNPPTNEPEWDRWTKDFAEASVAPNVFAKLSGLAAMRNHALLNATIDVALENFGPERLMFGSDWPVSNLYVSYEEQLESFYIHTAGLSGDESAAVKFGTARSVYGLTA